jgi:pimeloyl-ACP methyl ester carboxylesterase
MRTFRWLVFGALVIVGCGQSSGQNGSEFKPLLDARRSFATKLVRQVKIGDPVPQPPSGVLKSVNYQSPIGEMAAYVSPSPGDGKRHPVIIWLVGGFANSIGGIAWHKGRAENDQSAIVFREAGILMMYPSLRGGNMNPGFTESFYGEVDDVIAAADYVSKLDYVDTNRIYLGGHSTGGTLAMLVAESTNRFRSVFCFGPVESVIGYGRDQLTFDTSNRKELELRAPIKWLEKIQGPTFVFEGTSERSNISSLRALSRATRNPKVHFLPVEGATHFTILRPISQLIAQKILRDDGSESNIAFDEKELAGLLRQ